jgi:hypothetical protein
MTSEIMTCYLVDLKHRLMLAAPSGDVGGKLRHVALIEHACARWRFEPCEGSADVYLIRDCHHGQLLTAPTEYDGALYHGGDPAETSAQWRIFPMHDASGGSLAVTIKDLKHNMALVAPDVVDGGIYHEAPGGRMNAFWTLIRVP